MDVKNISQFAFVFVPNRSWLTARWEGVGFAVRELKTEWTGDALDWWKQSGLECKYSTEAMDIASSRGHIDDLDWWKQSALECKFSEWAMDGLATLTPLTVGNNLAWNATIPIGQWTWQVREATLTPWTGGNDLQIFRRSYGHRKLERSCGRP